MKNCNHGSPRPNCPEGQREPPEMCSHGRLKGTCTICHRIEHPDKICEHGQFKGACGKCGYMTEDTLTVQALINLGACEPAIEWAREQGPLATGQDLWDRCPKGQWALWFLVRVIPGHAAYHTFIRRMTVRALGTGLTFDKPVDPKVMRLREAIEAKEAWLAAASPEDLKARILWDREASWQQAFTAVWDNSTFAREAEINYWVRDLTELFPIKVSIQEKKGKWGFKADFVEILAPRA